MQNLAPSFLMMLLVLALIPLALWAVRRMQTIRMPGQARQLELLSQLPLGTRERVVTVRVHGRVLVLGATAGHITLLAELDAVHTMLPMPEVPAGDGGFAALLASLRRHGRPS